MTGHLGSPGIICAPLHRPERIIALPSPSVAILTIALHCNPTRVIHVGPAKTPAKGETMTGNTKQTKRAPASVAAEPKATKTLHGAKRGAHVGAKKAKSGKKAT